MNRESTLGRDTEPRPVGRRATLRDVAAEAGVSIQTVSNVLNGRLSQMSDITQQRVRTAMEALEYTVDRRASALRSGVTRTLAFLVLDEHAAFLADPLTSMIIAGVGDVTRDQDYAMLIQGAKPSSDGQSLLSSLRDRRVDGAVVLLSGPPAVREQLAGRMMGLGLPLVLMDEGIPTADVSIVRAAQETGARKIAQHLLGLGHTRIAFVGPRVPWAVIEQRVRGYEAALVEAGLRLDPSMVRLESEGYDSGQLGQMQRLMSLADPPTAIMCSSDLLALGAVKALRTMGCAVPDDVAVTGFDDFNFASEVAPSLTTLAVPGFEMGAKAAELLMRRVENPGVPPTEVVFPTELLVRGSTVSR